MLERYRTVAHQSSQDLEQITQAIHGLQSSGILAQQPPSNLEADNVMLSLEGESTVIQAYHMEDLTADMALALAAAGGRIVEAANGSYVMTAELAPEAIMQRSAMMAVGARSESAE